MHIIHVFYVNIDAISAFVTISLRAMLLDLRLNWQTALVGVGDINHGSENLLWLYQRPGWIYMWPRHQRVTPFSLIIPSTELRSSSPLNNSNYENVHLPLATERSTLQSCSHLHVGDATLQSSVLWGSGVWAESELSPELRGVSAPRRLWAAGGLHRSSGELTARGAEAF